MSGSYWAPAQVTQPGQAVGGQAMPLSGSSVHGMPQGQSALSGMVPLISMYMNEQRQKHAMNPNAPQEPGVMSQIGDWINQNIFGGPSPGNSAAPVMPVQQQPLPPPQMPMQQAPMIDPMEQSVLTNAMTYGGVPMGGA